MPYITPWVRIKPLRVVAKDPATSPPKQIGPVGVCQQIKRLATQEQLTVHPDQLTVILGETINDENDGWRSQISDSSSYGPHTGNVQVICELWKICVIVLEDSKREWKA